MVCAPRWLFRALFLSASFAALLALAAEAPAGGYRLAVFQADITPPVGSPLCGGWIRPAEVIDDLLEARGVVLLGDEKPIVLCALDWVESCNSTHEAWRTKLAEAAGTDPSRVAVQSVHPHNAPWGDTDANAILVEADPKLQLVDPQAVHQAIDDTAAALKASLAGARPITHIGTGQGKVEKVAGTRRVMGPDGKVALVRYSRSKGGAAREAPEGLIDPYLKTLSFWDGETPVAALHYYATHPMSYYGDGRVTPDFCGLARSKRQAEQPEVFQVYFTGCAGNITAGKYNDGTPKMRPILRDRIHAAMVQAWEATEREPIDQAAWQVEPVALPARTDGAFAPEELEKLLGNRQAHPVDRSRAAIVFAWRARADRPIDITCLKIGKARIVHLPGEPFIEYQLFAQAERPDAFVCVAGYGDGGPGYLPLRQSFVEGGYEPKMSFVAPESEALLKEAMSSVLESEPN